MHPIVIAGLITVLAFAALARDDAAVSVSELIARPEAHTDGIVIVRRIRCADPGGGSGFICQARSAGRTLRLDAVVLGSLTPVAVAEKLTGPCKGMASLERPACTFDALIEPKAHRVVEGASGPTTVITAQEIEILVPHRP